MIPYVSQAVSSGNLISSHMTFSMPAVNIPFQKTGGVTAQNCGPKFVIALAEHSSQFAVKML